MRTLLSSVLVLLASTFAVGAPRAQQKIHGGPSAKEQMIVGFAFDWDDNIFEMPTQIMLFDKKTGAEKGVSTEEFALIRSTIGKEGTSWSGFEFRPSPVDGSLRFFSDHSPGGKGVFLKDVTTAMTTPGYHWQGPVWNDFVTAMAQKQTSDQTWIITARLHAPATIHDALVNLQSKNLIKTVLPTKNIWVVGNENFDNDFRSVFGTTPPPGGAAEPSARKAAVMQNILDQINKTPIPKNAPLTVAAEGQGNVRQHLWGFSDDDFGNFSKARQVLQTGVDEGRWPRVKITLFYTGTNHPTEKPKSIVLRPKAEPRIFNEVDEWKKILSSSDGRVLNQSR